MAKETKEMVAVRPDPADRRKVKGIGDNGGLNARRSRAAQIEIPENRRTIPAKSAAAARDHCMQWLHATGGQVRFFVFCESKSSGWGCSW